MVDMHPPVQISDLSAIYRAIYLVLTSRDKIMKCGAVRVCARSRVVWVYSGCDWLGAFAQPTPREHLKHRKTPLVRGDRRTAAARLRTILKFDPGTFPAASATIWILNLPLLMLIADSDDIRHLIDTFERLTLNPKSSSVILFVFYTQHPSDSCQKYFLTASACKIRFLLKVLLFQSFDNRLFNILLDASLNTNTSPLSQDYSWAELSTKLQIWTICGVLEKISLDVFLIYKF